MIFELIPANFYLLASLLLATGSNSYRFLSTALIIERIFATYFARIYEKDKRFKHVGTAITIFSYIFVLGVSVGTVLTSVSDSYIALLIALMSLANVLVRKLFWVENCKILDEIYFSFQFI